RSTRRDARRAVDGAGDDQGPLSCSRPEPSSTRALLDSVRLPASDTDPRPGRRSRCPIPRERELLEECSSFCPRPRRTPSGTESVPVSVACGVLTDVVPPLSALVLRRVFDAARQSPDVSGWIHDSRCSVAPELVLCRQ